MSEHEKIDLDNVWIRAELERTDEGRRALRHLRIARTSKLPKQRRCHRRIAQRIARRLIEA